MADLKISQLTGATTPLAGTEVVPLVQSSSTKKVAVSDLTAGRQVAFASAVAGSVTPLAFSTNANSSFYQVGSISFVVGAAGLGGPGTELVRNGYFDGAWKYASTSTAMRYSQAGGQHIFYRAISGTGGTAITWIQNLTISTADDVTANAGNFVLGTAAKGVNFTANTPAAGMTSQLLNWYEEGTWTATLTAFSAPPTTPVTVTAYYTRIGRQVTIAFSFKNVDTTGASGPIQITGLPFMPANTEYKGAVQLSGFGATVSILSIYSGTTTMEILDSNNYANVNITAGTGKYLIGTATYFV